jgi:hypothetical protein
LKYLQVPAGGAVFASADLTVDRGYVHDNYASSGGALQAQGTLTLTNSRISENHSGRQAPIVSPVAAVLNSSITGNVGKFGASALTAYDLTMRDSTVSGNTSLATTALPKYSEFGSAIVLGVHSYAQTAHIYHSTIACNSGINAAIFRMNAAAPMTIQGSILSNTQGAACSGTSAFDIQSNQPNSATGSNNLVGSIGPGITFVDAQPSGADPLLLPLADNHGGTLTHALAQGSPAIDAGGAATESYDQRGAGFPRTVGGASDVGAFEYGTPFDDGACGSVAGSAPASLLPKVPGVCSVGSVLQFSGAGPWDWQCGDASGGARAACHARIAVTPALVWNKPFYSPNPDPSGFLIGAYVWGEPAHLEFSVNGDAPQGIADFYEGFTGDNIQCGGMALAAGKAECPVDTTILGRFYYYAAFSSSDGDYVFDGVRPKVELYVGRASSTTSFESVDPGTTVVGQLFATSARVAAVSPSTGTPTGTVTLANVSDGTNCSATLSGGSGTCQLVAATAGTKTLRASFGGMRDANGAPAVDPSQSADVVWKIAPASTSTSLVVPGPATLATPVMVSAAVSVLAPGAGDPTGTVTITDITDNISCSYDRAVASGCELTPPSIGVKTLQAYYAGDGSFLPSVSASGSMTVGAALAGMTLSSSVSPSSFGQGVTFTVTVTPPQGTPQPAGTVDFAEGATLLCANVAVSVAGGVATATCATSAFAAGTHSIMAGYVGDANLSAPAQGFDQVVQPAATTTQLTAPASAVVGQPAMVVASVAVVAPGAGTPTGSIAITDGGSGCTIALPATSCAFTPTRAGMRTLTATYAPADGNFAASSVSVPLQVDAPPPTPTPFSRWTWLWMAALLAALTTMTWPRSSERRTRKSVPD